MTSLPVPLRRTSSPWLLGGVGLGTLFLPTFFDLSRTLWTTDEQGHGPIVLALALWLLWRAWPRLQTPQDEERLSRWWTWALIIPGALTYALGRSQGILIFEVGSFPLMVAGLVALLRGAQGLRAIWFPLLFMCFLIPLPSTVVDLLTQPMKLAVSTCVAGLLQILGYPVARSGVTLYLGPYQLLVANACAGLNTLFTLEALGLLYLHVVKSASPARNVVLGLLIIPISFSANVVRVLCLCLITYHLGDEAGQGFLHGFAGMVLFSSALGLTFLCDRAIEWCLERRQAQVTRPKRILAVASEGGHWIQLSRLQPAFEGHNVHYLSTNAGLATTINGPFHTVTDANRWTKGRMVLMFLQVLWQMIKLRPDFVVTTGAAPGLAAVAFGRLLGARTIWLDSIANSEVISGSGHLAGRLANVCLTQWEPLADGERFQYWGRVL